MMHWKVGPREPDNAYFGKFLQEKRKIAKFSRAQIAAEMNLSSEYFRLIERGERVPAEGNFPKLMDILGVDCRVDGEYWVVDEQVTLEFTSRIREARRTSDSLDVLSVRPQLTLGRQKRLGAILELLVEAEAPTLYQVHTILLRSREKHEV